MSEKASAKSEELYKRALQSIPGGINSNSRDRKPFPLYFSRGEGAFIYDVDGNEYIDMVLGNGAIFFGHNFEPFLEKYRKNLELCPGLTTGFETELSVITAEAFKEIIPAEKVRFTNTGTEAVIHVMRIARAVTGKNDFALVEGAYNGWVDAVNISNFPSLNDVGDINNPNAVPGAGGLDRYAVESAVIIPYNNLEAAEKIIRMHKDRLAALILEPVMIDIGFVEPEIDYLKGLRRICDENGILLIFDELLTGFRVPGGSCQKWFGVTPDLAIYGKAIANGHILAAVTGKADVMESVASKGLTNFVGTFNGHVCSLAPGLAAMQLMKDGQYREILEKNTLFLIDCFRKAADKYGIPAVLYGRGGHLHWYFSKDVKNYRDAASGNNERYVRFANAMLEQNVYVIPKPLSHHAISVSHDQNILEKIAGAMERALKMVSQN